MEKVGIITLSGYFNYGNRLQNYALQETLKLYNYSVETICVVEKQKSKRKKNMLLKIIKDPAVILRGFRRMLYIHPLRKKRERLIKSFSNEHIFETSLKISENYLPKESLSKYKYFVTGSDQVWNPYYINSSPLYFLTFAPMQKRVSYAASFGISKLPDYCIEDYKKWLAEIKHLSVRESAGAELISNLTGRTAEILPDPTLLLTKEEWLLIAKPANNKPKKDYILTYFLGKKSTEIENLLEKTSKKYGFKIVNLAQPKYRKYYLTDPAEFLDFINSAKLFFTDSFHGVVFSILFETPFVVTDRKSNIPSMNSRINTLLSKYKLENRHISKVSEDGILNINFSHVESILSEERKRAKKFLNKALS